MKAKIQKEKQNGKLILITSHIMSDLEELASHIMYLQDGKLQFFKELEFLKIEFGEERLNKIIAMVMQKKLKFMRNLNQTGVGQVFTTEKTE